MRVFKSKPYRHAERALSAARTQEQVDIVRANAHAALTEREFGHFVKKVTARRQEIKNAAAGTTNPATAAAKNRMKEHHYCTTFPRRNQDV